MSFAVEFYSYFFFGFYLNVYIVIAVLLLAGASVLKSRYQEESYNLFYVFNTITPWSCLMILFYFLGELFLAWYGQNSYEWYAIKTGGEQFSWASFYWRILGIHLVGLLFFIRKLRINRLFILLFILLSNIELITRVIYSFKGGYQTPYWSLSFIETFDQSIMMYLILILLVAAVYVFTWKRNKLPYPSVFLK